MLYLKLEQNSLNCVTIVDNLMYTLPSISIIPLCDKDTAQE